MSASVFVGVLMLLARRTVAPVVASVTVASLATGTAVAPVAAGTRLTLYISLGLGLEHTHRETELACLLVDLYELDSDFVALLQPAVLH